MLLEMTQAGEDQIAQARAAGSTLPKLQAVVVDAALTQADLRNPVMQPAYEALIPLIDVQGNMLVFETNIPPDVNVSIRGFGLKTEDGVIIGYARYFEEAGGFPKRVGTNLILECQYDVTGRSDEITFVYQPFDVSGLIDQLRDSILQEVQAGLPDLSNVPDADSLKAAVLAELAAQLQLSSVGGGGFGTPNPQPLIVPEVVDDE